MSVHTFYDLIEGYLDQFLVFLITNRFIHNMIISLNHRDDEFILFYTPSNIVLFAYRIYQIYKNE